MSCAAFKESQVAGSTQRGERSVIIKHRRVRLTKTTETAKRTMAVTRNKTERPVKGRSR
jgi:hypothetical protein